MQSLIASRTERSVRYRSVAASITERFSHSSMLTFSSPGASNRKYFFALTSSSTLLSSNRAAVVVESDAMLERASSSGRTPGPRSFGIWRPVPILRKTPKGCSEAFGHMRLASSFNSSIGLLFRNPPSANVASRSPILTGSKKIGAALVALPACQIFACRAALSACFERYERKRTVTACFSNTEQTNLITGQSSSFTVMLAMTRLEVCLHFAFGINVSGVDQRRRLVTAMRLCDLS